MGMVRASYWEASEPSWKVTAVEETFSTQANSENGRHQVPAVDSGSDHIVNITEWIVMLGDVRINVSAKCGL